MTDKHARMPRNILKTKLLADEPCCVLAIRLARGVNIITIAQDAGYSGVYADLQHGAMSLEEAAQICHAALHSSITAFARVPTLEPGPIGRLLDAGAQGILAPGLRSADEARALVRAALLPPAGERSPGLIVLPGWSGIAGEAVLRGVNDATLLIAMIECEQGLRNAAAIGAVDGIDALQIGANDLAIALGVPGEYAHPRMQAAIGAAIAACRAANKPLILGGVRKPEEIALYQRIGAARCYFTGSDLGFVLTGATAAARHTAELDSRLNAETLAR